MKVKQLVCKAVQILEDKKARDIITINIADVSIIADYFVICSGTSTTHIRSLADEIIEKFENEGFYPYHIEGYSFSRWILLDYGDFIVHIFHEEDRNFYNLERLWCDGEIVEHSSISRYV